MRPSTSKLRLSFVVLSLVLVTMAMYWPVRQHDFINYDDQDYVTANPVVQQGLTIEGVRWAFAGAHAANWHPITWLSHMLDCQLFGLVPAGHHLVNVCLHAANAALVFLLFHLLTGSVGRSGVVAALFALHPLHIESVAWVAERKDILSAFFGLLAMLAYAAHAKRQQATANARPGFYLLALLLFALSLMSKPMLVTLPFLLLLLDCWPLRRLSIGPATRGRLPALLVEKIPFFALSAISSLITMHVQHAGMTYYANLTFLQRAANAIVSIPRYLGKTFWPQNLAILYPHPGHWPAWQVWGSTLLVGGVSFLVVREWRRRPYLAAGWFWFLGMLVPVSGLVQVGVQSIADRYTYLPLIGVFIMIVWAGGEWLRKLDAPKTVALTLAGTMLVMCGLLTRMQLRVWATTESVFTHAIQVTRDNWVAHYNLALSAMRRYQDTRGSAVESQGTLASLATQSASERDDLGEIIRHCEIVLQIKPGFPDPRITLAKALTERGQLVAARQQLETAIQLAPDNAEARQNLAEILLRQNQLQPALGEYRRALALKPDWPEVLNNLAWFLATSPDPGVRNGAEAVRLAQHACDLSGQTNLWFLHTLAAACAEAGDFTNATATAELALRRAQSTGSATLVDTALQRLNLYRAGQPLRDTSSSKSAD